jgi:hypothetical protein
MEHDQPFRIALIIGLALLLPVGVYHRVRSLATGEKLDRRQEGLFILVALRLIGLVRMAGLLAFVINPTWMVWSAVPLPIWLR